MARATGHLGLLLRNATRQARRLGTNPVLNRERAELEHALREAPHNRRDMMKRRNGEGRLTEHQLLKVIGR